MTNQNTFRLLFVMNRSKANREGSPILLRITINGERVTMNTQRRIQECDWNMEIGMPEQTTEALYHLSMYLETIRNKAFRAYTDLTRDYEVVTAPMIRDYIQGKNYRTDRSILEVWDEHNHDLREGIGKTCSRALWQKHCRARVLFHEFIEHKYRANDLPMRNMNFLVVQGFQQYLMVHHNFGFNTAVKMLQFLKKMTNLGLRSNWIKLNPFDGIKLSLKETDRAYLTEEELLSIENKQIRLKRIDLVKDIFLFSCYTGLAYADVKKLSKGEIERTPDGMWWIKTRRAKTDQKSQIPLLEVPKMIIDKYSNMDEMMAEDKLLPVMSNQKLNAYLKEIADMCHIEKNLTFHVARHTFATTVTLQNGVSIESVSRMMGHSNIKTTQHYARIVDKKIANDMHDMTLRTRLKMAR